MFMSRSLFAEKLAVVFSSFRLEASTGLVYSLA